MRLYYGKRTGDYYRVDWEGVGPDGEQLVHLVPEGEQLVTRDEFLERFALLVDRSETVTRHFAPPPETRDGPALPAEERDS